MAKPSMIEFNQDKVMGKYYIDQNDHKLKLSGGGEIKEGDWVGTKKYLAIKDSGEATFRSQKVFSTSVEGSYKYIDDESEHAEIYSNVEGTKNPEKALEKIQDYYNNATRHPRLEISQSGAF